MHGQKPEKIHEDMERDKWLDANEAKSTASSTLSSPRPPNKHIDWRVVVFYGRVYQ